MRHFIASMLVACIPIVACSDGTFTSPGNGGAGGSGANSVQGGAAAMGGGGDMGGGGNPGGGGSGGMPECTDHPDCTEAGNAQCDGGTCVPCTDSSHCNGVVGLPVCDNGTCIECMLGQEGACVGTETCDLLAKECVDVAPGSVQNCEACTNDLQCETDHRCIPMDFPDGTPHGHYCLEDAGSGCAEPFAVFINEPSISGAAAVNYCGIEEDNATCEAVLALLQNWRCSGTDGMCSPDGILPEQPVPGAICEQVGALANRCTYACDATPQCPGGAPQNTCGNGDMTPPGWCGG